MLSDIVVDANVLVHANNPGEPRHQHAIGFVGALASCTAALCIDPGFDLEPSRNRSLIGQEYLEYLHHGTAGYELVAHLAAWGRLRPVPREVERAIGRRITQLIRNKRDRTYLRVARNTKDRVLASHDFTDFSDGKRTTIAKELQIIVATADEARALLTN